MSRSLCLLLITILNLVLFPCLVFIFIFYCWVFSAKFTFVECVGFVDIRNYFILLLWNLGFDSVFFSSNYSHGLCVFLYINFVF